MFHCLFGLFRSTQEFFLKFEGFILGALMAIEQQGFFSVPTYCDTGYPSIIVISSPVIECLAVELSFPVFTTYFCPDRGSNIDLPDARR